MRKQIVAVVLELIFIVSVFILSVSHASAATSKLLYLRYDLGGPVIDMYTINSNGTSNTNLTNNSANLSAGYNGMSWSPDGTKIAFIVGDGGGGSANLHVMNADGSNNIALTSDSTNGIVGSNVEWSPDGTKILFEQYVTGVRQVMVINADGTNKTQLTSTNGNLCPQWSPDGTTIYFVTIRDGDTEIYKMNSDGTGQTNITNDATFSDGEMSSMCSYQLSPNGSKIVFTTNRDSNNELYIMNNDGTGQTRLTTSAPGTGSNVFPKWSHNGVKIAYGYNPTGVGDGYQVFTMNADGSNQTQLTTSGDNIFVLSAFFGGVDWSPDDSQMAFSSNRSGGAQQVYIMNSDGTNQTLLVSDFSFYPLWQPQTQSNPVVTSPTTSPPSPGTLANTGNDARIVTASGAGLVMIGLALIFGIRRKHYKVSSRV